jgi:FKBP-type peptidyl-prolyl cis-trans isomerase
MALERPQTGEEFDASCNRGQPFRFTLGRGHVIHGWDSGVAGMKVGGRRRLTIPSAIAYGARGAGGVIKPHERLVFAVDLLSVELGLRPGIGSGEARLRQSPGDQLRVERLRAGQVFERLPDHGVVGEPGLLLVGNLEVDAVGADAVPARMGGDMPGLALDAALRCR